MASKDGNKPAGGSSSGRAPILPLQLPSNIARLPSADRREKLRILEALLFAASEPLDEASLAKHLGAKDDVKQLLDELQSLYSGRGVNLVHVAGKWAFRTAEDLSFLLEHYSVDQRKLSKAALETLAIIAYHQPVTRAEIESIRGVETSRGTLDILLELGWIRPGKPRETPGRPLTWKTTPEFLSHFNLASLDELPGVEELKAAGLLDTRPVLGELPREKDAKDEASDTQDDEDFAAWIKDDPEEVA